MNLELFENLRQNDNEGKQLQEELDQYNKNFYNIISFFPEAYGMHVLDKNNIRYKNIEEKLDKNKSDMYSLYIKVNKKVKENHKKIQNDDKDIDNLREKRDNLNNKLDMLNSHDVASEQQKIDKVDSYRRQVVEMLYLLAGIGIMGGSIYKLTK